MKTLVKNSVFVFIGICAAFLIAVNAEAGKIPASGDSLTEGNASEWVNGFGVGTIANSSDAAVGSSSISYSVPVGGDGLMFYPYSDFSPYSVDLSTAINMVFHAKIDAATTGMSGNFGRIELRGPTTSRRLWHTADLGLTTSWVKYVLPLSSFSGTGDIDLTQIKRVDFVFLGSNRAFTVKIDGLYFETPVTLEERVAAIEATLAGGVGLSEDDVNGLIDDALNLDPLTGKDDIDRNADVYNTHTHDKGSGGRNTSGPTPEIQ